MEQAVGDMGQAAAGVGQALGDMGQAAAGVGQAESLRIQIADCKSGRQLLTSNSHNSRRPCTFQGGWHSVRNTAAAEQRDVATKACHRGALGLELIKPAAKCDAGFFLETILGVVVIYGYGWCCHGRLDPLASFVLFNKAWQLAFQRGASTSPQK